MRLVGAALVAAAAVLHAATPFQARSFGVVAFDFATRTGSKLAELGVGIVRGSCSWESLEPARGEFRWDCADNLVVPAGAQRLRSYLTVTCTPEWANGGRGCARMPTDVTDWYD